MARTKVIVLSGVFVLVIAHSAMADTKTFHFDCGTATSPVAEGYQRLTAEDAYNASRGYGWERSSPSSVVFAAPKPMPGGSQGRSELQAEWLHSNFNDLNTDGVVSASDLAFRLDVPDGTYRLTVTIGDMSTAIGSIDVLMNDEVVSEHAAAWAVGAYRFFLVNPAGWWAEVRHTVAAKDGCIRISLRKNQSYYDEQLARQIAEGSPPQKLWHELWTDIPAPYYYIGWPFVHNSIMAIKVVPDVAPPVVGKDDKLSLTRPIDSPALSDAIASFNRGKFEACIAALDRVSEPEAEAAKAVIQLWLAGRPEIEMELALTPPALETLRAYVGMHPEESGLAELLQDAETFYRALDTHVTRGDPIPSGQKNHFIENDKAITLWCMIPKESPLYYKSQIYIARAAHMLLPYIPTAGGEGAILRELEKKFPDNRYVKYLLHWQWDQHGDGTHRDDWYMVDYLSQHPDAPAWARQLQARWANILDWAEWWMRFKQRENGSVGGGWGDDVEIAPDFAYLSNISRGASPLTIEGCRKLVEGMWNHSEVDPELGYCLPMADTGHSAEWTGNTIGMMAQLDYGNPVWIERSMKTAKLMRDIWTSYDVNGHRHFRSNMLGAAQVGTGDQMNDAWINYRALPPAAEMLAYSNNPTIAKLFLEYADAWLAAAMSTERGKPMGVIPAQVAFPDGTLGGTNSPNWYTASHSPGTDNADWGEWGYKGYMHSLFTIAYRLTGDAKYLEPLRLEYELGKKHGNPSTSRTSPRLGTPPWERESYDVRDGLPLVAEPWQLAILEKSRHKPGVKQEEAAKPAAEPGSERWVAEKLGKLDAWLVAKSLVEGRKGELKTDISKDDIVTYMSLFNRQQKIMWPLMTTEASATDRAYSPGLYHTFAAYTGGGPGGPGFEPALTYADTTRYFAAAVLARDPQGFRLFCYLMTPEKREIGIVPWVLEVGGRYRLRYGPDADENEVIDSLIEEREFDLPQRGAQIRLTLDPNKTYLVEAEQIVRGKAPSLAPDPAVSDGDIRYSKQFNLVLVTVHNIGAKAVRNVTVALYDGDPKSGGTSIGTSTIPNVEAPIDLDPKTATVAFHWLPAKESHDIYAVVDPDDEIKDEITTSNNMAHKKLPEP